MPKRLCAAWEVIKIYPFDSEHWIITNEVRNVQEHSRFIDSGSWFHVIDDRPAYSGTKHHDMDWTILLDDQDDYWVGLVLSISFAQEVVNNQQEKNDDTV